MSPVKDLLSAVDRAVWKKEKCLAEAFLKEVPKKHSDRIIVEINSMKGVFPICETCWPKISKSEIEWRSKE